MPLKTEDRTTLVEIRIEKSGKTLQDAQLLADNQRWAAAANRLYYAAYYAVSALLLKNGISVKTHEGMIQMFGKHFIKSGIVSQEMGKTYSSLFSLRLTGDYEDDYNVTQADVMSIFKEAEALIAETINLTNNQ